MRHLQNLPMTSGRTNPPGRALSLEKTARGIRAFNARYAVMPAVQAGRLARVIELLLSGARPGRHGRSPSSATPIRKHGLRHHGATLLHTDPRPPAAAVGNP